VELVASVVPRAADALSSPDTQWKNTIDHWHCPGRFTFFVFQVEIDYCADAYFPGLQLQLYPDGYNVGGSLDQWDKACYALLNTGSPHDCCVIYRKVYKQLTSLGYRLSGKRTSKHENFYLL